MEAQHLHRGMGVHSVGGGWEIYERYRHLDGYHLGMWRSFSLLAIY